MCGSSTAVVLVLVLVPGSSTIYTQQPCPVWIHAKNMLRESVQQRLKRAAIETRRRKKYVSV